MDCSEGAARIEEIQETNDQLGNRTIELNQEYESLMEYRDTIANKSNQTPCGENQVKFALQSLISVGSSNLIQAGKYVDTCSFDNVYFNWQSDMTHTGSLHCFGCGQEFGDYHGKAEPAYNIHCIKECERYQVAFRM